MEQILSFYSKPFSDARFYIEQFWQSKFPVAIQLKPKYWNTLSYSTFPNI